MLSSFRNLFRTRPVLGAELKRSRSPARPRTRLQLEPLEERTLLTTRFVVPVGVTPNNTTTFNSVRDAFQFSQGTLAAGDVIQIEPGSQPGPLTDGNIRNLANLTLHGNPAFTA